MQQRAVQQGFTLIELII
ncbi:MAG: prepilin-type N-terminal cleavage/methylation domain-containing protein, partial [Aestuariibacter sp.]|nr:prepilin-type N-terminal cleavage/methylation domain-containing protein [Aestuariibacter sp.]MCP5008461.1 prepilin-type N-terminal cleavage/methylation domain-containing protein [Aestuariibacter sp.]